MASSSIDTIVGMFPHATILLTHAPGMEPTYDSLHASISQLHANAASVPNADGDGILGHLVLTLGNAEYSVISMGNVAHLAQAPPAAAPIIPAGTTTAMIAELRQQYNGGKKGYKTYYAVDAAVKSQLLQATDNRFVATLKHATHGFALVRTRTIIQHLYNTYGRITAEMMAVNDEKMRSEWDPGTPIEIFIREGHPDSIGYSCIKNKQERAICILLYLCRKTP
jgi:hypothetical protein